MAQDPPIAITVFESDKNPQGARRITTWEGLGEWLRTPLPLHVPKSALPMWSPAIFAGDRRASKNVEAVSCMVFDVDEAPVPSSHEIVAVLQGISWFLHSSSSATNAAPRWRLIVRLSQPVDAAGHAHMWRYFVERLPFKVGQASKDPSRAWYAPREGAE